MLAPSRTPELVDDAEQLVGGVAGEDVGQARLDADARQREPAGRLPLRRLGELRVAELDAGLLVGPVRVRVRQGHRHVEVVGAGRERTVEDRHDEAWVDSVEDVGGAVLASDPGDVVGARRVDPGSDEARVGQLVDDLLGPGLVVVGDDVRLEELPTGRDLGRGRPDAAGADHEDAHGRTVWHKVLMQMSGSDPAAVTEAS